MGKRTVVSFRKVTLTSDRLRTSRRGREASQLERTSRDRQSRTFDAIKGELTETAGGVLRLAREARAFAELESLEKCRRS